MSHLGRLTSHWSVLGLWPGKSLECPYGVLLGSAVVVSSGLIVPGGLSIRKLRGILGLWWLSLLCENVKWERFWPYLIERPPWGELSEWEKEYSIITSIIHSFLFSPISRSGPIYLPGTNIRHNDYNVRLFYSSKGKKVYPPLMLDASLGEEFSVESLSSSPISTNEHSDPNSAINTKKVVLSFPITFWWHNSCKNFTLDCQEIIQQTILWVLGFESFFSE